MVKEEKRMEKKNNVWGKWLYWFVLAVAIIIVYKTLDNFSDITNWIKGISNVLMPFIIGLFLAYLFYIPCKSIEKLYKRTNMKLLQKRARMLSVITVYLIALLIIIIAINFILPTLTGSIADLVNNMGTYYENTIKGIEEIPADSILRKVDIKKIVESLNNINIEQYLNVDAIIQYAKGAIGIANGVFDFFVSLIVSIYILIERTSILAFLKKLASAIFKPKTYQAIGNYFNKTNNIFFKFLASQLLDAFVVGVLTSVAMMILGVKYAGLLGFMIGVSNLIPYFGAIVGVGVAILITVFTGGIGQAIWMGIVVIILQQIDANIINPKIVGNSLKISPLLVIFAVTVGGAYFGMLGMFLAVPVFTVIKIIIEDYVNCRSSVKQEEVRD